MSINRTSESSSQQPTHILTKTEETEIDLTKKTGEARANDLAISRNPFPILMNKPFSYSDIPKTIKKEELGDEINQLQEIKAETYGLDPKKIEKIGI